MQKHKKDKTNLKTKINQNCQKIEFYGSPTTKESKKKTFIQTGRRGRKEQPGQRGHAARQWLVEWKVTHSVRINQEEQLGSMADHATQGPSTGN